MLLKYRVTNVGPYPKSGPYPESPMALEDAQRTVGLVRLHAAEWHIDPHKIGVLGFSAGGHLVGGDQHAFCEAFVCAGGCGGQGKLPAGFCGGDLSGASVDRGGEWDAKQGTKKYVVRHAANADMNLGLNPDVPVTGQTPPTFLLQAEDDHVDTSMTRWLTTLR